MTQHEASMSQHDPNMDQHKASRGQHKPNISQAGNINFFEDNNISIKGSAISFSTPNRIIINFSNISKDAVKKSQEIRGPSVDARSEALEGFLKSHDIKKSQLKSRLTEKGELYSNPVSLFGYWM